MPKGTRGLATCSVESCGRGAHARGLCALHDWRLRTHGSTDDPRPWLAEDVCLAEDCGREARAMGYCTLHYQRVVNHGSPARPQRASVPVPHGTLHGYRYHRCRCEACRAFWAVYQRNARLKLVFGMTSADFDARMVAQDGLCAICRRPEVAKSVNGSIKQMSVDHDHSCCPGTKSCGKCVQGLICAKCNIGIGMFEDDIDRMDAAIAYLRSYRR